MFISTMWDNLFSGSDIPLFCTGEMLNAPIDQVQELLEEMVGGDANPATVYSWAQQFQELQQEEKQKLNLEMLERQREAVSPSEGDFFTLWENPGKATNWPFNTLRHGLHR